MRSLVCVILVKSRQRRLLYVGVLAVILVLSKCFRKAPQSTASPEGGAVVAAETSDVISEEERALFEVRVTRLTDLLTLAPEQEGELRFYFEEIIKDIAGGASLAQRDFRKALYGDGLLPILNRVMTDQQRTIFEQHRVELGFPEGSDSASEDLLLEGGAE